MPTPLLKPKLPHQNQSGKKPSWKAKFHGKWYEVEDVKDQGMGKQNVYILKGLGPVEKIEDLDMGNKLAASFNKKVQARYEIVSSRAARFLPMFTKVLYLARKESDDSYNHKLRIITDRLKRFSKIFKKEDNFLWIVKLFRDAELFYNNVPNQDREYLQQRNFLWDDYLQAQQDIEHYLQNAEVNGYRSILNFKITPDMTPKALKNKLASLEEAEIENSEKGKKLLEPDPEVQTDFLKFQDGWKWVLVNKETCLKEGAAMEHCGNAGAKAGDQILSLREPFKKEKKEKPHLTFILNNGLLGQMKGVANSKPAEKYYKYILPLLKDQRIESIKGGGYASDRNFSLNDLPKESKKELLDSRPNLDFKHFVTHGGHANIIPQYGGKLIGPENRWIIIDNYKNIEQFIKTHKMPDINETFDLIFDIHIKIEDGQREELLENFITKKPKEFRKMFAKLVADNGDVFKDKLDIKDKNNFGLENFEREAVPILTDLIEESSLEDLVDALDNSIRDGVESEASSDYVNKYKSFLSDISNSYNEVVSLYWENLDQWWDSEVWLVISLDTFLQDFEDIENKEDTLINFYDPSFPEFRWSGDYSYGDDGEAYALEQLQEHHLHSGIL